MAFRELIDDLLAILRTGEHDVSWTRFRSTAEVVSELEQLRERIDEDEARERLKLLCLPTGAIEEIAVSSGWASTWVHLVNSKYRADFA
ncbi:MULTISPECIES: hypothetical protein [Amycolatopsis]|uniref:Uncharacterized protein n=1 Tax=Amycolatopsis dongchuanensis TaxID=1070866 RepID=A0ABP9QHM9_9PSEU